MSCLLLLVFRPSSTVRIFGSDFKEMMSLSALPVRWIRKLGGIVGKRSPSRFIRDFRV